MDNEWLARRSFREFLVSNIDSYMDSKEAEWLAAWESKDQAVIDRIRSLAKRIAMEGGAT